MPNLNVGLFATTIVMGTMFPVINAYAGEIFCTNANQTSEGQSGSAGDSLTATGCGSGTYYDGNRVTCTCPSDSSKYIDYICDAEFRMEPGGSIYDRETVNSAYWQESACYTKNRIDYNGCFEIMETCTYHANQGFDEYGSKYATINAMCAGFESGSTQDKYCRALCNHAIYQKGLGKTYDMWYCGAESCSSGMYMNHDARGVTIFYDGTYTDVFYVQDCYECDYGTYQPDDNYTGTTCTTCPKGYYSGTASVQCSLCPAGTYYDISRIWENEGYPCFPCPEFPDGNVSLGSSPASGNTLTEQCYVPANTGIQDTVGIFVFSDNCYYEDESLSDGEEETSSTTTTAE